MVFAKFAREIKIVLGGWFKFRFWLDGAIWLEFVIQLSARVQLKRATKPFLWNALKSLYSLSFFVLEEKDLYSDLSIEISKERLQQDRK